MIVSIETPVFKGRMLQRLIDSVLHQSSPHWHYSLLWDGGDEESRRILEELEREKNPQVTIYFAENRGIARARRFLSEHSQGEWILPVDDDDVLPFHAVERFLEVAAERPWASVIRAQRKMIDEQGKVLDAAPWFPFEPRHYQQGMVTDLMNHTHPYLMKRSAYQRTTGWEGFEDFGFAGEDCDIYIKLEEVGTIELFDETLYYYRIHNNRASLVLTEHGAYEMWRRLADKAIARIGLPLKRASERPPFTYEPLPRAEPTVAMLDVVIAADDISRTQGGVERLSAAFRAAGIPAAAIQVASRNVHAVNQAMQQGARPLVCLVDAAIRPEAVTGLGAILRSMHENGSDLAAPRLVGEDGTAVWANPRFEENKRPVSAASRQNAASGGDQDRTTDAAWVNEKFMITRREVIRAVGGLDEGFDDLRGALVDFSLRARQRRFRCSYVGGVAVASSGADRDPDALGAAALERLRAKWAEYPDLFA
ncbi:MAG TPA: glycosyltransferase [Gemmatimonadaceae bacterium]|nr:glycosyltransferase [Gemmatimonadaceae bacterium]